jgi:hypothetical protein
MLSETFWIAFVGTMTGFLLKLCSMCYKSKCKKCSFCGFEIVRDTEEESEIDMYRLEHPPTTPPVEQQIERQNTIV